MAQESSLADFIHEQRVTIVGEWQAFAQTLLPAAGLMTGSALRDHANEILTAIIGDMNSQQTAEEQSEKSKGRGQAQRLEAIGGVHAALRIENGFKLGQLVAEYRALRASVLRLWARHGADAPGVTRFNEAIDEALIEAVKLFATTSEHYRDQTLGILGHDLRNPLSAMMTASTMLLDAERIEPHIIKVAARVLHSAANRMNRMVADLLDLTRTRAGDSIPVTPMPMDLQPLCHQLVAELSAMHPQGGVRFTARGSLRGRWDGDRISQVISNLLHNAIRHGSSSEPIDLIAEDHGTDIVLRVHNCGRAIPLGVQASIFEPMVRHVGNERLDAGIGLGLYIASQVVLAHHGTLTVTSSDVDGTTFTVRLPRHWI
ncbi:MAG: Sensor histidine kinase [Myxococcaceae bacterium]|nr:Sensor histidine kinase [Myxococcaceae bacterium]